MIILKIILIWSNVIAYSGLKYGLSLIMQKKKPLNFHSRALCFWWVGRDWLRRKCVFELATNGL